MNRLLLRFAAAGALMLLAQLAHAQYSWIDDKGTRVFSDRPPPPGTPAGHILTSPQPGATAVPAPPSGDKAAQAAQAAPADRDADARKRQQELATYKAC